MRYLLLTLFVGSLPVSPLAAMVDDRIGLCADQREGPIAHAAAEIRAVVEGSGLSVEYRPGGDCETGPSISLLVDEACSSGKEGFRIVRAGERLEVCSSGSVGAMYGGLAVAEELRTGISVADIAEREEAPTVEFRAIKFNLPWDSYRRSPALQMHEEAVRDLRFWESFLDMMVENRFNVLSLWNLHPFNYMVRPAGFPEATGFSEAELAEWKNFWHALFGMASDRGIGTYLVFWNIFVSPEFARAHDVAPYAIEHRYFSEGDTSAVIKQYTREVVAQVIDEYPDLTGLGVGLGEGMGGMTPREREEWILETVVAGMQDAQRPARLIHRVPFSADRGSGGSTSRSTEQMTREAMESIEGLEHPIWVEIKFNWSHGHSTPKLVKVHGGAIDDTYWEPLPEAFRIAWMIRNEDFFALRWGVPDFIRAHVRQNLHPYVGGYFVGSETYIPAVDYFTRPDVPTDWTWAFERQWLFYKLWGRLLYDPATPDAVFSREFVRRYGAAGENLLEAYAVSSSMPLRLASFYDLSWDFTLYSEGFLSKWGAEPTQFIDIDRLINHPPLDPQYVSVGDYVEGLQSGTAFPGRITPLQLADELDADAGRAVALVSDIDTLGDLSLRYEVADVVTWSSLSRYFADKLRGGVALQRYRVEGAPPWKQAAVEHLEAALDHWDEVIDITRPLYREMPLVHLNGRDDVYFHWHKLRPEVEKDLQIAREAVH